MALPYPAPAKPATTAVMKGNRRSDTKPEVMVRSLLHRAGFRFQKDLRMKVADVFVRPDIVFTRRKIAIFIDGCFWHLCPQHGHYPKSNRDYWVPKLNRNLERDRRADAALLQEGWTVLRAWEHLGAEATFNLVRDTLTCNPH